MHSLHAGGLLNRTLVSQVRAFEFLFVAVASVLGWEFDVVEVHHPEVNFFRSTGRVVPWPIGVARETLGSLAAYFRFRPLRSAQDLARHWP